MNFTSGYSTAALSSEDSLAVWRVSHSPGGPFRAVAPRSVRPLGATSSPGFCGRGPGLEVVPPVPALPHLLHVFPLPRQAALGLLLPVAEPQRLAVLVHAERRPAHQTQVVLVAVAGLGRQVLGPARPGLQVALVDDSEGDLQQGAGEGVLLGHAEIRPGIPLVEGPDQQPQIRPDDPLVRLHLGWEGRGQSDTFTHTSRYTCIFLSVP